MARFKKGDRVILIKPDGGGLPGDSLIISQDNSSFPYAIREKDGERTCISEESAMLRTYSSTSSLTKENIDTAYRAMSSGGGGGFIPVPENYSTNKKGTYMSKITRFVKNLALSADDKLLRKFGFQDECGEYTTEAREFALSKLCEDKKAEMVAVAQGLEQEEKNSK